MAARAPQSIAQGIQARPLSCYTAFRSYSPSHGSSSLQQLNWRLFRRSIGLHALARLGDREATRHRNGDKSLSGAMTRLRLRREASPHSSNGPDDGDDLQTAA